VQSQHHTLDVATDEDWVVFYSSGTADNPVEHTIIVEQVDEGLDIKLVLYQSDGVTEVARADAGGAGEDEQLSVSLTTSGMYFVKLTAPIQDDQTFTPGAYHLRLQQPMEGLASILVGNVVDSTSGEPLSRVSISTDKGVGALSLPDGSYSLIQGVGDTELTFSKEGYKNSVRTVTLSELKSSTLNVSIVPNKVPVANNVSVSTREDVARLISLNGKDDDRDELTYHIVSQPNGGTLSVLSGNQLTYTPIANRNGTDSFTYRVSDAMADSSVATVSINVSPVNDAPIFTSVSVNNAAIGIDYRYLLQATDIDGDNLQFALITQHNWLSLEGDMLFGNPTEADRGEQDIVLRVSDGKTSDEQRFTLTVFLDTDKDSIPNEVDNDDDNDGIDDNSDTYPLVAIGELPDTDGDGAPNGCDESCAALGMAADPDDDNDGVDDRADTYPLVAIGDLLDTDGDGAPNECDES
jgi:hypothetical protein